MTRRTFFSKLAKGIGCFTILPPAETYQRIWVAIRQPPVFTIVDFLREESDRIFPGELEKMGFRKPCPWSTPGFCAQGKWPKELGFEPLIEIEYDQEIVLH